MRRLKTILLTLLTQSLLLCGCHFPKKKADFPSYTFTNDTLYPTTPIKHQGKTSNCWAYAVASLFETEMIMECNDTINLSPEYWVRAKYEIQFDEYSKEKGEKIARGGLGHTALLAFRQYGATPLSSYKECYNNKPDFPALLKEVRSLAKKAAGDKKHASAQAGNNTYREELRNLLDTQMGIVSDSFPLKERTFTPKSLAQEFPAYHHEYIELTSFDNRPMHEPCLLKLTDNREQIPFFNVELDELMGIMTDALRNGYTFVWDGDVSEAGFSMKQGFAFYTGKEVNARIRYKEFESGDTTDDHMMHIVGLAHNQHGERYFITKNSVGKVGPYEGFIYLSEDYVKIKTVSILINKACVTTLRPTLALSKAVLL